MIMFLIQVAFLLFSVYVFTPLFGATSSLGGFFKLITFAPFGFFTLFLGLFISLLKLFSSLIMRKGLSMVLNLILVVLYLIIGLVFVF